MFVYALVVFVLMNATYILLCREAVDPKPDAAVERGMGMRMRFMMTLALFAAAAVLALCLALYVRTISANSSGNSAAPAQSPPRRS